MDFVKRNSLASVSSVQSALKALMNSGIVSKEKGSVLIEDRFFSKWIRQNYGPGI